MSVILIISPECFDRPAVSKHHYAIEFANRGHTVFFCGPPVSSFGKCSFHFSGINNLYVLNVGKVFRGIRFLPRVFQVFFERRWLRQIENILKLTFNVIINFENSRFYNFGFADDKLKIYFQVDLNQCFNPLVAAASADLSIGISDPIEKIIRPVSKRFLRLTHGYSATLLPTCSLSFAEVAYFSSRKNVAMTGNMEIKYLDRELIRCLVVKFPDVFFHFIGPYDFDGVFYSNLKSCRNVMFWGKQPSELLPNFYALCEVLLVTYLADDYFEQLANPHKIMEYLGSGKCVLATKTLEYLDKPNLIEIANSRSEYIQKFENIIENVGYWNSEEKKAFRKLYASMHSYSLQVDRIVKALGEKGFLLN